MKKLLLIFIFFSFVITDTLSAQRDKGITYGQDSYSSTTRYSNGTSSTNNYLSHYFILSDSISDNSEFGAIRQKVGILGSKIKHHLSLDPQVQSEFKSFRRKNSLQYVGIPAGFAFLGIGLSYELGDRPELTEKQANVRAIGFYALGTAVAGVSYYISYKSWDTLENAISRHNKKLGIKPSTIEYGFEFKPTLLLPEGNNIPVLGFSTSLKF